MKRPWIIGMAGAGALAALAAVFVPRFLTAHRASLVFERTETATFGQLAFTPGGRLVVIGMTGEVEVVDAKTGVTLRRFTAGSWSAGGDSFDLSADGRWLATVGEAARVWDLESDAEAVTVEYEQQSVRSVALVPGRNYLVVAYEDRRLLGWDLAAGATVWDVRTPDWSMTMAVPESAAWLAAGGYRMPVQWWPLSGDRVQRDFGPESRDAMRLAARPDGGELVSWHGDGMLRAWDVASGRLLRKARHDPPVTELRFDHTGRRLLVGDIHGAELLDASSWRRLVRVGVGGANSSAQGAALSADGTLLAAASTILRVWRLEPPAR